ncbi:unnamed protein product, partial [Ranitomeya imitator]
KQLSLPPESSVMSSNLLFLEKGGKHGTKCGRMSQKVIPLFCIFRFAVRMAETSELFHYQAMKSAFQVLVTKWT